MNQSFEKFASRTLASLIDFFSLYQQVDLNKEAKDLTRLIIPLRLIRMTTFPQVVTNSTANFVRIVKEILANYFRDETKHF